MTVQADKKLDFEILEGSENPIGGGSATVTHGASPSRS